MSRKLTSVMAVTIGFLSTGGIAAEAQTTYSASVVSVTDGDTLTARMADGRDVTVRIIGIDAPEVSDCGGSDARAMLEDLVQAHVVELETDPSVAVVDDLGRSRFYVDRPDGVDVGLEMVRRGWAEVIGVPRFQRLSSYVHAEADAQGGVWEDCDGNFHFTEAEQRRIQRNSAKAFVGRYYRRLSSNRFRAAWGMLGGPVKRTLGYDFRDWRSGYRRSVGVAVRVGRIRLGSRRSIVTVRLRSRDRDICSRRLVAQRFRGSIVLAPRGASYVFLKFRIRKTGGKTPRLSKSQCPAPKPPPRSRPAPPSVDCQGYSPCIPPGPDVDCLGGSGNGPRYVDGPVSVGGSDPYDLDRDGDGVACES